MISFMIYVTSQYLLKLLCYCDWYYQS